MPECGVGIRLCTPSHDESHAMLIIAEQHDIAISFATMIAIAKLSTAPLLSFFGRRTCDCVPAVLLPELFKLLVIHEALRSM
jgi:hypothetical protein